MAYTLHTIRRSIAGAIAGESGSSAQYGEPVIALHTDGRLLFVNYSFDSYARFTRIDKTTIWGIANFENYTHDDAIGLSHAPSINKIFGPVERVIAEDDAPNEERRFGRVGVSA